MWAFGVDHAVLRGEARGLLMVQQSVHDALTTAPPVVLTTLTGGRGSTNSGNCGNHDNKNNTNSDRGDNENTSSSAHDATVLSTAASRVLEMSATRAPDVCTWFAVRVRMVEVLFVMWVANLSTRAHSIMIITLPTLSLGKAYHRYLLPHSCCSDASHTSTRVSRV